jgi:hypothetical protein
LEALTLACRVTFSLGGLKCSEIYLQFLRKIDDVLINKAALIIPLEIQADDGPITRSVGNFCYFFLWLKFSASVFAF